MKTKAAVKIKNIVARGAVCDECGEPLPAGAERHDILLEFEVEGEWDYKLVCPGKCRQTAETRMLCQR